jgi:hypothetical protein
VLVVHQIPKFFAHLVTALARLHVQNLARRSSLEAGSTRDKKGGEERRNVTNSAWQFSAGNKKFQWRARVYPERENELVLPLQPNELLAFGTVQSALVVGGFGREIFVLATCL